MARKKRKAHKKQRHEGTSERKARWNMIHVEHEGTQGT